MICPPSAITGIKAFQDSEAYGWRANSSRKTTPAVSPWPALGAEVMASRVEMRPSGNSHSIRVEGLPLKGLITFASKRMCGGEFSHRSQARLTSLVASTSFVETQRVRVPGATRHFQAQ